MPESIPLPLELDDRLIDPPIVDFLHFDTAHNAYVITFIPGNNTSHSENEVVEIPAASQDGFRVGLQLKALAGLLNVQCIERVSHLGGSDFEFFTGAGEIRKLSDSTVDSFTAFAAYRSLQDIAMSAEVAWIMGQRSAEAVA